MDRWMDGYRYTQTYTVVFNQWDCALHSFYKFPFSVNKFHFLISFKFYLLQSYIFSSWPKIYFQAGLSEAGSGAEANTVSGYTCSADGSPGSERLWDVSKTTQPINDRLELEQGDQCPFHYATNASLNNSERQNLNFYLGNMNKRRSIMIFGPSFKKENSNRVVVLWKVWHFARSLAFVTQHYVAFNKTFL